MSLMVSSLFCLSVLKPPAPGAPMRPSFPATGATPGAPVMDFLHVHNHVLFCFFINHTDKSECADVPRRGPEPEKASTTQERSG